MPRKNDVPVLSLVDGDKNYRGKMAGSQHLGVNKIAKTLLEEGRALKIEYTRRDIPHCHRCGTSDHSCSSELVYGYSSQKKRKCWKRRADKLDAPK